MINQAIFIRADANSRIGTGHVMRCFSLAQGLKRSGAEVSLAATEIPPALKDRLSSAGIHISNMKVAIGSPEDAVQTIQLARKRNADWIVADGYSFGGDYQRKIKQAGFHLLLFDDYGHADDYCADLVLNQNLHASAATYSKRDAQTHLLLGTRYALLRQEFLAFKNQNREIPDTAKKILVTLGGADPDNVTGKVIEVLREFDAECKVVVGGSNPHVTQLKSSIRDQASKIELIFDARNMPELMAWTDIAIAAGGTTSWELAFMGVPSLMFTLAENQRKVADALASSHIVRKTNLLSLADDLRSLIADSSTRSIMSQRARQLMDGLGVNRIINHLKAAKLQLRPVCGEDCRQIWEWANDEEARAVSLSQDMIPWENHVKWFSARVNSPSCFFYMVSNGSKRPIGQIRFEVTQDEAVLSVSLAKESRGNGYGPALIVQGARRCFADSKVKIIRAYVKPKNENSLRAFEKTDFVAAEYVEVSGHRMQQFILKREA